MFCLLSAVSNTSVSFSEGPSLNKGAVPWASQVAQWIKNPPANQRRKRRRFDQWVEKIPWMIHSIILAWRIPWTEDLSGLQSMGLQRVGHD